MPMLRYARTTRQQKKRTILRRIPMSRRAQRERVFVGRMRTLMQKCSEIEKVMGCLVTLTLRLTNKKEIWYYATNDILQQLLRNGNLIDENSIRTTRSNLKQNVPIGKDLSENSLTGDNTLDCEQQLMMDNTAFMDSIFTPDNVTATTITEIDDDDVPFAPEQDCFSKAVSVHSPMKTNEGNTSKVAPSVKQTKIISKSEIVPLNISNAKVEKSFGVFQKSITLDEVIPANPRIIPKRLESNECDQNDKIPSQLNKNTRNPDKQHCNIKIFCNKPSSFSRGSDEFFFHESSSSEIDEDTSDMKGKLTNRPSESECDENNNIRKNEDHEAVVAVTPSDSSSSSASEYDDNTLKNSKNQEAFGVVTIIGTNSGTSFIAAEAGNKKQTGNGEQVQLLNGIDQQMSNNADKDSQMSNIGVKRLWKNQVNNNKKLTKTNEYLKVQHPTTVKPGKCNIAKHTKRKNLLKKSDYTTPPKCSKINISKKDKKMKLDGANSQASGGKSQSILVVEARDITENESLEKTNVYDEQSDKANKSSSNASEEIYNPFVHISPVTRITSKSYNNRDEKVKKRGTSEISWDEWTTCRWDSKRFRESSILNRRSEEVHRSHETIKKSFGNTQSSFGNDCGDFEKQFEQGQYREKSVPRNFKPVVSDQNNNYTSDIRGSAFNDEQSLFDQSFKNKPFSHHQSFLPEVKKNEYDFLRTTNKNETSFLRPTSIETANTTSISSGVENIGTTSKSSGNRSGRSTVPFCIESANYGNSRKRSRNENWQCNNDHTHYENGRKFPERMNSGRSNNYNATYNRNWEFAGNYVNTDPRHNRQKTCYNCENKKFSGERVQKSGRKRRGHRCRHRYGQYSGHTKQSNYGYGNGGYTSIEQNCNGKKKRIAGKKVRGGKKMSGGRGCYGGGQYSGHAIQSNYSYDNGGYINTEQNIKGEKERIAGGSKNARR